MASVDCLIEQLCRKLQLPKKYVEDLDEDNRYLLAMLPDQPITLGQVSQAVKEFYADYFKMQVGPYGPTVEGRCSLEVRNSLRHLIRVVHLEITDHIHVRIDALS